MGPEEYRFEAPDGPIREKYAAFVMVGEPGYEQRWLEMHYVGDVNTAKSTALVDAVVISALEYPGAQLALVRDKRTHLMEGVYRTLRSRAAKLFENGVFTYIKDENVVRCENGSAIYLFGLDVAGAEDHLVGTEWFRIFIDQAERIKEELLDMALMRIRQKCYWRRDLRVMGRNYIKTTANWDQGRNWIWKRCIPGSTKLRDDFYERRVEGEVLGEKITAWRLLVEARTEENWSRNRQNDEAALLAGEVRARFMSGDWTANQGLVFREFNYEIHEIDHVDDFQEMPIYFAVDHGLVHPTAAVFGTLDEHGVLDVVLEYAQAERSAEQNARTIARILREFHQRGVREFYGCYDRSMDRRERDLGSVADDYRKVFDQLPFRVEWVPAVDDPKGSIERGIGMIKDRLLAKTPFGTPLLRVSRRDCPMLLRMFADLTYEDVEKDTIGLVDMFDALRYLVFRAPSVHEVKLRGKERPYRRLGISWVETTGVSP